MAEWIVIRHRGCVADGVAFFYDHRPGGGEQIQAHQALTVAGVPPLSGQPITCGSCGMYVGVAGLEVTDETVTF